MNSSKEKALLAIFSLALALVATCFFLRSAPDAFPLDDAYIHLTYARNLAEGRGFSFNPGEPSYGSTSPLWVLVLATAVRWVEPHLLVRVISSGAFWASLFLSMFFINRSLEPEKLVRFDRWSLVVLPALLLASFGNYLWIVFCGMESALWTALILAAVYFSIREKPSWAGYAFMGLAALGRFEAVLLIPLALAWQLAYVKDRQKIFAGISAAVLITISFNVYAQLALGSFFPTTRAGKLASDLFNSGLSLKGGAHFIERHLSYLKISQPQMLFCAGYALLAAALWLWARRKARFAPGPVAVFSLLALGVFLYHDQFFRSTATITPYHNLRYQVLLFPVLALGIARTSSGLLTLSLGQKGRAGIFWYFVFGALLAVNLARLPAWRELYLNQCRHIEDVHIPAAKWCKTNLPAKARIACFDIGSLGFYAGRYVIDLGGLIDPDIHPYLRTKRVGPYLKEKHATNYIELGTPADERITGVRKDAGKLYQLEPVADFQGQRIPEPVTLHSWEMKIFAIQLIGGQSSK